MPLPYYLSPGTAITLHHDQHGEIRATILPFSPSPYSGCQVVLVRLLEAQTACPLHNDTQYIVKIFDPRFLRGTELPWNPAVEAEAARIHHGTVDFNPKQRPETLADCEYEERPQEWELAYFRYTAWLHHNECLAYEHLARLQGSVVPTYYGSGTLDLSGTEPPRAITPFVVFLEYIQDAVSLAEIDARLLTEPLMRAIVESGDILKDHGVIHPDANPANFLLAPAHAPTRVVVIDFAGCWTRAAAVDDEDWEGAKMEWNITRPRKLAVVDKLEAAGLPIPEVVRVQLYF